MSHCYWCINTSGELDKGMQTGELFSMSNLEQQHQPKAGGNDEFDFASIFNDDPSWLASIPNVPITRSSPTAQLAAMAA